MTGWTPLRALTAARRWAALLASCGFLIGVLVCLGHTVHSLRLVQLFPGQAASMVLGTAVSLALTGLALLIRIFREPVNLPAKPASGWLSDGLAAAITLLGSLQLLQTLFDVSLGVDVPDLHTWINDYNPHPGRMAPNTALAFVTLGIALLTMPRVNGRRAVFTVRLCTGTAIGLAITGLLGTFLALDFLFSWHGITRMAPHTAVGLLCLGLSLWACWHEAPWNGTPAEVDDRRVGMTATAMLIAVTTIAGLVGFASLQRQVEAVSSDALHDELLDRSNFFSATLDQYADRASVVASGTDLGQFVQQAVAHPGDLAALQVLERATRNSLPHGFSVMALLDTRGTLLAQAGSFRTHEELSVALNNSDSVRLLWDQGFYLSADLPVTNAEGVVVGRALTQQPIQSLTRLVMDASEWGETGELGVCAAADEMMACFPHRFAAHASNAPRVKNGRPYAMSRALSGESGITRLIDGRGQRVIAAYRPIGVSGLAMVVKIDLAEVYAPIRQQFLITLPILALLVIGGVVLLQWRLRPLLRDIVASRQAAIASEARFRVASESSLEAFFTLTSVRAPDGEIVDFRMDYINASGERMISIRREKIVGKLLSSVLTQLRNSGWLERYKRVVDTGRPIDTELKIDFPEFTAKWVHQHVVPLGDGVAITVRDIGDRKYAELQLKQMAQSDALTGLPNRPLFLDRLERAMIRARRGRGMLALLYLDIDRFKSINDTHGHAGGDAVLKEFAQRLTAATRVEDTVARLGGDEFVILLENLASRGDGFRCAESIMSAVRADIQVAGQAIRITTSIGIAFYHGEVDTSATTLIKRADAALYEVKRRGRDGYFAAETQSPELRLTN